MQIGEVVDDSILSGFDSLTIANRMGIFSLESVSSNLFRRMAFQSRPSTGLEAHRTGTYEDPCKFRVSESKFPNIVASRLHVGLPGEFLKPPLRRIFKIGK